MWAPGFVGAILGGGANAIKNYDKLSGRKYWESVAVGAASGFVAAYAGVFGGATIAALNEIHDQTLHGKDITNYDTSQIMATVGVAGAAGSIAKSLTDLGKGFALYSDDLFAQVKNLGSIGVIGEVAGTYSDLVYSPEVSDRIDDLNIPSTFEKIFNDFKQRWGVDTDRNDHSNNNNSSHEGLGGNYSGRNGGNDYGGNHDFGR